MNMDHRLEHGAEGTRFTGFHKKYTVLRELVGTGRAPRPIRVVDADRVAVAEIALRVEKGQDRLHLERLTETERKCVKEKKRVYRR